MLIELRVIGGDEAAIEADIEYLAMELGVVAWDVTFERVSACTLVGTALAERVCVA